MTDQDNTAPAVWDPTARGGAGGWVRRRPADGPPQAPQAPFPPHNQAPQQDPQPPQAPFQPYNQAPQQPPQPPFQPGSPVAPPPTAGAVGDEGPPLAARPYLASGAPTPPGPPPAPPFGGPPPPSPMPGFQPSPPQPPTAQPPLGPPLGQPPQSRPPTAQPFGTPQGAPQGAPGGFPGQQGGWGGPAAPGPAQPPFPSFNNPPYQQQQSYPQQPEYESADAYYDDESPRSRRPLYIALGVVLIALLGAGAVWAVQGSGSSPQPQAKPTAPGSALPAPAQSGTGGAAPASPGTGGSPSASSASSAGPNAAAQAKSLSDLLTQAESTRSQIGSAVAKVRSCPAKADVDKAVEVFDAGAKQRDQLLASLGQLNLGDVPGGSDLSQLLQTAWQQSGDIDRSYAAWARTVSSQGCASGTAPNTADKQKADGLNPQATRSKNDFIAKWKPVADSFGLPESTADRI